jgi:hypothetical protein
VSEETVQKFASRIDRGDLTDDVKVVYRVEGAMPYKVLEPTEEEAAQEELMEVSLSGDGTANAVLGKIFEARPTKELSGKLGRDEYQELFLRISAGLGSLVPRSDAAFLPDSMTGSITIELEGEEETLYFLADEQDRLTQDKPIAPDVVEAIKGLEGISQRLQEQG